MAKVLLAFAALASLNALAWSSSTAWQWNTDARQGVYAVPTSVSAENGAAFGPRVCVARTGAASGVATLEARVFGTITLTGLVLERYGALLIVR